MSPLAAMFLAVSAVAVAGGLGAVVARNVVYASLSLLLSLMAIAGIYVLLFAPFLAVVQVLIYGGAIVVVVLFALMLTRRGDAPERLDNRQRPLAAITGLAALGTMAGVIVATAWPDTPEPEPSNFRAFSETLFGMWAVPFEIASLLLLVALIGAIVIARPGDQG